MLKLGYLGPQGTFSEEAAVIYAKGRYELVPLRPISQVLDAFLNQEVDRAIVPIENLIEGEVNQTIDYLITHPNEKRLQITGELLLPIRQMLVGKPGTNLRSVKRVVSHLQALSQCQRFLNQYGWEAIEVSSTAQAAQMVSEGDDLELVAIASASAAEIYHLEVLVKDIGDSEQNITRFIFLGGPASLPTGNDKTTIFFVTKDEPGALYHALGPFFYQGINLSKIASRTAKTKLGEYVFWVEAEGHQFEPVLQIALTQLKNHFTQRLWVAGSYPKAGLERI